MDVSPAGLLKRRANRKRWSLVKASHEEQQMSDELVQKLEKLAGVPAGMIDHDHWMALLGITQELAKARPKTFAGVPDGTRPQAINPRTTWQSPLHARLAREADTWVRDMRRQFPDASMDEVRQMMSNAFEGKHSEHFREAYNLWFSSEMATAEKERQAARDMAAIPTTDQLASSAEKLLAEMEHSLEKADGASSDAMANSRQKLEEGDPLYLAAIGRPRELTLEGS
jgi:hypothetical protein